MWAAKRTFQMGKKRFTELNKFCSFILGGKYSEGVSVDTKIIVKLIFNKWDREAWPECVRLRIRTGGRHF